METNQRTSAETRAALHEDLRRWREDSAPARDIKDRCFYATPALLDDADALAGALAEAARYKAALKWYADPERYAYRPDEQKGGPWRLRPEASVDGGEIARAALAGPATESPHNRALDSLQALQGAKTANDAGMAQDARTARNTGG